MRPLPRGSIPGVHRSGFLFLFLIIGLAPFPCGGAPLPTPPPDWKLEVVAAAPQVRHPSVVCCAPDGRVFVAEDPMDISAPSADLPHGRILCFHPDGRVTTFADKLHAVFGMQYLDGELYVLHNPKFTVFTDDPSGVGKEPRDLIRSTNPNPWALDWNDHVPANFRLAMDGYFYVAVGDKGLFNCVGTDGKRVDLRGGGIVRLRPDGSGLEIYCTGVRNILDVAMNDEDEIFTYDNTDEHHWMGRLTHMVDGGFYGYPWDFIPRRPYTLWMMADYGAGAATGTLCYTDDVLPAEFRGNLFLADFGKRNILRVKVERDGATYKAVSRQDLFTDVPADFRPVGICFSPDGKSIYICDWQHADTKEKVEVGRLLKMIYTGKTGGVPKPTWYVPAATGQPFDASPEAVVAALSHPSREVRMVGQRRLVERPDGYGPLQQLMDDRTAMPLARSHALWALHAIDRGNLSRVSPIITAGDASPILRRQALRLLGMRRDGTGATTIQNRLNDDDSSVRFHAATALGRIGNPGALRALTNALNDSDSWVRFGAWTALNRIARDHFDRWESIAAGLKSPEAARREGTSFALRGTYDPRLVKTVAAIARDRDAPAASRVAAMEVLAPLHHQLPEWKGEWWAYHPALAPPPAKTRAWEGTPAVLAALRAGLDDHSLEVRLAAIDALRDAADPASAAALRSLVAKDRAAEVRRRVIFALAACDDGASADFLLNYLDRDAFDDGTAVSTIETLGRLKAAQAVPTFVEYAHNGNDRVRDAAVAALARVGGEKATAAVVSLLSDPAPDVRRSAVRAAGEIGDRSAVPKLIDAMNSPDARTDAITALARMPDARATHVYLEGLASNDFTLREKCKQALREIRDAALPAAEAAAKRPVPDEVILELRQVYQDHAAATNGPLFAAAISRKHPDEYLNFSVNNTGDARAGAKLFAAAAAGGIGCATCHAVNGTGGAVGPDLSGVGAKFSRRDLAEALLYPSKAVREGYQQVIVRTKSGQTYAGPLKAQTPQELTLHEADGTLRRIPLADVAARKDSGLSPMPDNLHAGLTVQQFTDLVSYLESLKTEPRDARKERNE